MALERYVIINADDFGLCQGTNEAVISGCDLLIASRMHAAIAALSTIVLVIGIAYSHKMLGIYKSLGMDNLIIDIKNLDWGITYKIKHVLANSEIIKNELKTKIPKIKELAEKPAYKVAGIINHE